MFNTLHKTLKMPPWAIKLRLIGLFYKLLNKLFTYNKFQPSSKKMIKDIGFKDFNQLIDDIESRDVPMSFSGINKDFFIKSLPAEGEKIKSKAEKVMNGYINILGSGDININPINWHYDYKTDYEWPNLPFSKIDTQMLDLSSDVKFPWELSRMQWLMPVCQAWMVYEDDIYSDFLKKILLSWIKDNPCAQGVNWSCTMEPSIRVLSLIYFFYSCKNLSSWKNTGFNKVLLKSIYEHLDFISKHVEISDINGNHLISNASALVAGGIFLGNKGKALKWNELGWRILNYELDKQVYSDGVNYEGSIPYHRLVTELLFLAVQSREINTQKTNKRFRKVLIKMASYIDAYSRFDNSCPVIGDSDDGRALNFGGKINNHKYLSNVINISFDDGSAELFDNNFCIELFFWAGVSFNQTILTKNNNHNTNKLSCRTFPIGGSYIVKNNNNHLFIDCGPVGLAERGGHGHNDCLSFTASLNGIHLISDPGSYVYTSDIKLRQHFRSTRAHNTPFIANTEINSFISPKHIWHLYGEASPSLLLWEENEEFVTFAGCHSGYQKLKPAVTPLRKIVFDKINNQMAYRDSFYPNSITHEIVIPLQLSPEITINQHEDHNKLYLSYKSNEYTLYWDNDDWATIKKESLISSSYGNLSDSLKLEWISSKLTKNPLTIFIMPSETSYKSNINRLSKILDEINIEI